MICLTVQVNLALMRKIQTSPAGVCQIFPVIAPVTKHVNLFLLSALIVLAILVQIMKVVCLIITVKTIARAWKLQ